MEGIIAQRYAQSLFELGAEFNIEEEILLNIRDINNIFSENEEFTSILSVPTITKEEKVQMLDKVFGNNAVNIYTLNFLKILAEKGRLNHFSEIVSFYGKLYNRKNNIKEVIAITAIPLNENMHNKLKSKLEDITGKKIVLHNNVDTSILGGIILKMDDDQLDGSVKGRLDKLKSSLNSQIA